MPKNITYILLFSVFLIGSFSIFVNSQFNSSKPKLSEDLISQIADINNNSSTESSSQSSEQSSAIVSALVSSSSSTIADLKSSISETVNLKLRQLTGQDFNQIFESFRYPKVSPAPAFPVITDNLVVDEHIRALGEKRGYKKRAYAQENQLVPIDGMILQTEAKDAWVNLKKYAQENKINLVLTSGYRSPNDQRSLFVSNLAPQYPTQDLLDGKIDPDLNQIMNIVSLPGYSRHHTGYTIDIACGGESTIFKNTSCYQWMKKDNFANARRFGWIPSYPEGVTNQGPNPEEWEFVWVGDQSL